MQNPPFATYHAIQTPPVAQVVGHFVTRTGLSRGTSFVRSFVVHFWVLEGMRRHQLNKGYLFLQFYKM
jgi:hypothetical protein